MSWGKSLRLLAGVRTRCGQPSGATAHERTGLPRGPRIAIVGADLREQNEVAEQVGQTARLVFLDRKRTVKKELPDLDYLIVTRHTGHEWWTLGVQRYGRDRVQRISTSGVGMIVRKVDELAKRPMASS
jgi:hypothetical protein